MFSPAQLRRLGPLVLWLVLVAQAAGIAPLISTYVQHAIENAQDVAADLAAGHAADHLHRHHAHHEGGGHEHGAADPNDQCCALHHLAGVLPAASPAIRSGLTASVAMAPLRSALAGIDPGTLERPPKLPLPV